MFNSKLENMVKKIEADLADVRREMRLLAEYKKMIQDQKTVYMRELAETESAAKDQEKRLAELLDENAKLRAALRECGRAVCNGLDERSAVAGVVRKYMKGDE